MRWQALRATCERVAGLAHYAVDLLRAMHAPEYLTAKARDLGRFSVFATVITALFVSILWIWDYAVDSVHWKDAFGLRMAEAASVLLLAAVMRRDPVGRVTGLALFLVPLWVEVTFIEVLARLEGGASYGVGGFLYFFVFVPFLAQAQSLRFTAALLAVIALFPNLLYLAGIGEHLNLVVYNAYVWMVYPPVIMIVGLVDYLLYRTCQARHELQEHALTDPLTGAYNRRYFMEAGQRLFLDARRHRQPISLLFVDADHFKSINDRHGHACGDHVLQALSRQLASLIRPSEIMARYGGEEFVILLPNTDASAASAIAERIRQQVAERHVELQLPGQPRLEVTVSVGLATRAAGDRQTRLEDLLHKADEALYAAKRAGRDRVVVAALTSA